MTELYRRFDPQTRRLAYVTPPSAAGGTTGDTNAVRFHFLYPNGFDLNTYRPYIVFGVKNAIGQNYTFSRDSQPAFNGKEFIIPNEVMVRVKGNKLAYQLVFIRYDQNSGFSQEIHSLTDTILVASSIDIPVSIEPELDARLDAIEDLLKSGGENQALVSNGLGDMPVWTDYPTTERIYITEQDGFSVDTVTIRRSS